MCGRFFRSTKAEKLKDLAGAAGMGGRLDPSWNIGPSQDAFVLRRHPTSGLRHLDPLRWGFESGWSKARPVNARAETLAAKPMFREAFQSRRGLVPCDGFYEWKRQGRSKRPFAFTLAGSQPMMLGALWEAHRRPDGTLARSFALITVPANPLVAEIHDRMPLILTPEHWAAWLGETPAPAPESLLLSLPASMMRSWEIGPAVGNIRQDGPDLLRPLAKIAS
jgi:putative SOS response-associated peptidase YedK